MNYRIFITHKAELDINEAADYIEFTLMNPSAADNLLNKIEEEFNSISFMPEKHQIIDDPFLSSHAIRMVVIDNYIAFYTVDESQKIVTIIRFIYGRRNWISILRQTP